MSSLEFIWTARRCVDRLALGALWMVLLNGCSSSDTPPLATVSGTVTMNGQPLTDATVVFVPPDGRPASGLTDSDGEYELSYNDDADGCRPGICRVLISTGSAGEENDDGEVVGIRPETVPAQFNVSSTLTFDVLPETHNQADFSLTGEVVLGPSAGGRTTGASTGRTE